MLSRVMLGGIICRIYQYLEVDLMSQVINTPNHNSHLSAGYGLCLWCFLLGLTEYVGLKDLEIAEVNHSRLK